MIATPDLQILDPHNEESWTHLLAERTKADIAAMESQKEMLNGIGDFIAEQRAKCEEDGEDFDLYKWVDGYEAIALAFATTGHPFMTDDVYEASVKTMGEPPSSRVHKQFPHIIRRLNKSKLIQPWHNTKARSIKSGNHNWVWVGSQPFDPEGYWTLRLHTIQKERKKTKRLKKAATS